MFPTGFRPFSSEFSSPLDPSFALRGRRWEPRRQKIWGLALFQHFAFVVGSPGEKIRDVARWRMGSCARQTAEAGDQARMESRKEKDAGGGDPDGAAGSVYRDRHGQLTKGTGQMASAAPRTGCAPAPGAEGRAVPQGHGQPGEGNAAQTQARHPPDLAERVVHVEEVRQARG